MPRYFCLHCGELTDHVNVRRAAMLTQVSRGTVYNWMHRELVHFVLRPSGRKMICVSSLVRAGSPAGGAAPAAGPHGSGDGDVRPT